jgi:hypothetical protein
MTAFGPTPCTIPSSQGYGLSAALALFEPNNVPTPVLSFQSQPSNTITGATMASFVVAVSQTFTGNVTLTANNCAGVSFSGLTEAVSGTTATFNAVLPTGIANGCTFTASAMGATPAISNAFNITGIPAGLSFTQQPTDTVNNGAFQPPVAGRRQ